MKTCCPGCQTIFRITPEQLKARAGKVRCGQCRTVFNALDALIEEAKDAKGAQAQAAPPASVAANATAHEVMHAPAHEAARTHASAAVRAPTPIHDPAVRILLEPTQVSSGLRAEPSLHAEATTGAPSASSDAPSAPESSHAPAPPMSEDEAQALGKAAGLIMPRDITEAPGYDKWSNGVMAESPATPSDKPVRWPIALAAALLLLALLGQIIFHFRGELAIRAPAARPALEAFAGLFGAQIPLPRHSELISIEASDLQADPARANLLTLNATLRNRAAYAQAFPSLELTLTNTDDNAVARRILAPADYLPARLKGAPSFAANTDIAVRLWIETDDLGAAGYRLYIFYPQQ